MNFFLKKEANKVKDLLSSRGMSMIEVMMSVGLTSIMALGLATMVSQVSSQVKLQEDKLNVLSTKSEILTNVQSKGACTSMLSGQNIANGSPLNLGPYRQGAIIGNKVEIDDVVVSNVSLVDSVTSAYSAEVSVLLKDRTNPNIIFKPFEFVLYYTVGAGVLTECGNGGEISNLISACQSIGAQWNSSTNSCNIDNAVCASLGGTLDGAGTCSALASTPPPNVVNCNGQVFAASESSQRPGGRQFVPCQDRRGLCRGGTRYTLNPSTCTVSSGPDGTTTSGTCSGGNGSCSYSCSSGSWTKISNNCYSRTR